MVGRDHIGWVSLFNMEATKEMINIQLKRFKEFKGIRTLEIAGPKIHRWICKERRLGFLSRGGGREDVCNWICGMFGLCLVMSK